MGGIAIRRKPAAESRTILSRVIRRTWKQHLAGQSHWEFHIWDILMFQAWLDETHSGYAVGSRPYDPRGRRARMSVRVLHASYFFFEPGISERSNGLSCERPDSNPRSCAVPENGPRSRQSAESIPVFTTAMEREISPLRDLLSLCRLYGLVRRLRPAILNVGTPKAGLLVGVSGMAQPCSLPDLHLARSARGDRTRNQAPHSYPDRAHRLRLRESRCLREPKPATTCR